MGKPKQQKPKQLNEAEESFFLACRAFKHPIPEREFVFHPVRRYRFDFAWPDHLVAMEVEGGIYDKETKGRHTSIAGFEEDCIKYALAAQLGWRLYRFTTGQVKKGIALMFMEEEFRKWQR